MKKPTECVKVSVRCRPLSKTEVTNGNQSIVNVNVSRGEISVQPPDSGEQEKTFTFDVVVAPNTPQELVYNSTALPIVQSVLEGYNGTIFAYGQTGTGKTHTMEGPDNPSVEQRGIIPRAFDHIFRVIQGTPDKQFLVRASFLELYNQEIRDLLSKGGKKLELRENPDSGVYVKDLSAFVISSVEQMQNKLVGGRSNRATSSTDMNERSSRSHSIFIITVETSEIYSDGQSHIRVGKLNLVDLAGSQRQSKTHATGDRFKEAININQSLATLGNVISALVDEQTHVPYRDSQLTRLLQDSLGGNTKTVMIANVGPADYNFDETISTLRYASRAKSIKNKPKINEDPKDAMIRQYQEELMQLKEELTSKIGGKGIRVNPDGTVHKVVEKVVQVTDDTKLKMLQEKRRQEREEIKQKVNSEIKQSEEEYNMTEQEKRRIQEELEQKQKSEEIIRQEQEQLVHQIKEMEEKLLHGSKIQSNAREQEKMLLKARLELEERQQSERRMAEELEKREALQIDAEEKYKSIQEEIEAQNKKINKLVNEIKESKEKTNEIHEYRLREKEILLEENRNITRELKLINLIIENFIPPEEVKKLENKLDFSDEVDDWIIKDLTTEENRLKRPESALDFQRPMCEFTRMSVNFGQPNPRFRHDNILTLDLDLPERTTEELDSEPSQKLQETINIALNEDEQELQALQNEKMPNVYIQNPDQISKESAISATQKPRLASARKSSKRPQSGIKKV